MEQREFSHLLERATRGDDNALREYIAAASPESLEGLRSALDAQLDALPVPLRHLRGQLFRQRRILLRLRDSIDARRGRPDALLRQARESWLSGGSHVEYLRLLLRHGQAARAISMAIALLDANASADREALEAVLHDAALAPAGWMLAVARFAERPSEEAWRALQRFTPREVYEARVRYTVRLLVQLGVPAEQVFFYATLEGVTPEAIGMVEEGAVPPRVVEARARRSAGRAVWYGLAARAACVRGDHLGTVRLLRQAMTAAVERTADIERDVAFIMDHADDALRALLRSTGLASLH